MRMHISSKDFDELPNMALDQTGELEVRFRVVGANKYDDETFAEDTVSYDLECEIVELTVKKFGLQDALKKATETYDDDGAILVKNVVQPSP